MRNFDTLLVAHVNTIERVMTLYVSLAPKMAPSYLPVIKEFTVKDWLLKDGLTLNLTG